MSRKLLSLGAAAGLGMACMVPVAGAYAADKAEVSVVLKDHRFQPAEIQVPAGKAIVVKVDNRDATAEEFECHALGIEKIVAGKSTGIVRIRALKAGRYKCVGEFHEDTAKATIIAK